MKCHIREDVSDCPSASVVRRLRQLLFAGCLLSASIYGGCAPATERAADRPEAFIFARGSDAQKLDPADVDDGESVNSLAQVMEGLVRFRPGTLEIEPWLARAYSISDDGTVYTFELREDVQFHDGTPLTAETALFTFHRQMDPGHPAHLPEASFQYWGNLYSDIVEARAAGPMKVILELKQPNASILYSLASFPAWLVSPGGFEKYGSGMQRHPVGTGPYKFSNWQQNQAIIFEKNPHYWGELAKFDRLVIRSVPENTVRLLELKSGKIHGLDGLQPAELADLINDPQFTVYHRPGMNVGYMAISDFSERLHPPEVRHAIAMAIDREAIVKLALDGWGVVAEYPIPPGFLGEPEGAAPIRFDPAAAREILRRHPVVTRSPVTLHTINAPRPYFPDPGHIASLIRSDLEAVGMKVNIVTKDFKSHLHDARNGDFDLCLLGWSGDNGDTDNFLATFFASWAAVKGAANNIAFYRNPEMDELLLAGRRETIPDKRQKIYERALALWARDMPLVPLVSTEQIVVMRREVEGFVLAGNANIFLGPVGWGSE